MTIRVADQVCMGLIWMPGTLGEQSCSALALGAHPHWPPVLLEQPLQRGDRGRGLWIREDPVLSWMGGAVPGAPRPSRSYNSDPGVQGVHVLGTHVIVCTHNAPTCRCTDARVCTRTLLPPAHLCCPCHAEANRKQVCP